VFVSRAVHHSSRGLSPLMRRELSKSSTEDGIIHPLLVNGLSISPSDEYRSGVMFTSRLILDATLEPSV
jgi:hypothetical protein